MKTIKLITVLTFVITTSFAQTLYVPGGTVGNNTTTATLVLAPAQPLQSSSSTSRI